MFIKYCYDKAYLYWNYVIKAVSDRKKIACAGGIPPWGGRYSTAISAHREGFPSTESYSRPQGGDCVPRGEGIPSQRRWSCPQVGVPTHREVMPFTDFFPPTVRLRYPIVPLGDPKLPYSTLRYPIGPTRWSQVTVGGALICPASTFP